MKKTLLIVGVSLIGLASCKKDYTCACTTTVTVPEFEVDGSILQGGSTTTTSGSTVLNGKKDEVKAKCESGSTSTSTPSVYASQGVGPTTTEVSCKIAE